MSVNLNLSKTQPLLQNLEKSKNQRMDFSYQPTNAINDVFNFSKTNNQVIAFGKHKKKAHVVTAFKLENPYDREPIAIQMKVRGVTAHQRTLNDLQKELQKDKSVNKLADMNWDDGLEISHYIKKGSIMLAIPSVGEIGRVPDEIAEMILPLLEEPEGRQGNHKRKKKNEQIEKTEDFKFTLSNVVAGTTKGASTTGLRVNLVYEGFNQDMASLTKQTFHKVLNDPDCSDSVFLYQKKTSPKEVLKLILDYETKTKDANAAKAMNEVVDHIIDEIESPENKKILLLGHCKPDGDTLGCILGMKNAIDVSHPEKQVECAVDDKIPGLFRHNIPNIDTDVKRPSDPVRIKAIEKSLLEFESKNKKDDKITKDSILMLQDELKELKEIQNSDKGLDPNEKYDLVILMDVPTPKRFTNKFKPFLDDAKKVIYIDHHPHRFDDWEAAKSETGVDMKKIHENKLAWIADTVPAATEQVAIIASKLPIMKDILSADGGKIQLKPEIQDKVNSFVASVIAGMSTDTGAFTRTANLLPEHDKMPVQKRPNFMPEGLTKFLTGITTKNVGTKKWLRDVITYDLADPAKEHNKIEGVARNLMLQYAVDGRKINEQLGLGIVEINYDQMANVLATAHQNERDSGKKAETTLLDVQNGFKYSEVLNGMREVDKGAEIQARQKSDPSLVDTKPNKDVITELYEDARLNYVSQYDDDRIAVLICQDKKAGALDEKLDIAEMSGLRLSLRSQNCSNHAELIAGLFGGGGHGGASGGRVDLPGITLDSKLVVTIDGKREPSMKNIYRTLVYNDAVTSEKIKGEKHTIELSIAKNGKTCTELITSVANQIRNNQDSNMFNPESMSKFGITPLKQNS